jgi:hypothetical protein
MLIYIQFAELAASMTTSFVLPTQQLDIEYVPNVEKWRARTQQRLKTEKLSRELPSGFPTKLISDLVWEGDQLKDVYDCTYELNDEELNEIEHALVHFQCKLVAPELHRIDR